MANTTKSGTDPRNTKRYYLEKTLFSRVFLSILTILFFFIMKIKITGLSQLPRQGGLVLAANHLSGFDPFLILCVMPRPVFFMSKMELFDSAPADIFFRLLGGFPVKRDKMDKWALRHAKKILSTGKVLGIFPEGSRSKTSHLQEAKVGAAWIALRSNCPIVPMAISGTPQILKRFPRRAVVDLKFGQPIYPQTGDTPEALTEQIMMTIAGMLPPHVRGVYGG